MGAGREVGSQDIGSREGRRESKYMKQERKEGVGTLATGKDGGSRDIGNRKGRAGVERLEVEKKGGNREIQNRKERRDAGD